MPDDQSAKKEKSFIERLFGSKDNETKQAQQNKTGAKEEPVKNSKLQDEPKARPRRNSMV